MYYLYFLFFNDIIDYLVTIFVNFQKLKANMYSINCWWLFKLDDVIMKLYILNETKKFSKTFFPFFTNKNKIMIIDISEILLKFPSGFFEKCTTIYYVDFNMCVFLNHKKYILSL